VHAGVSGGERCRGHGTDARISPDRPRTPFEIGYRADIFDFDLGIKLNCCGYHQQLMTELRRVSSGVDGLDRVLAGGFPARRAHMLRGQPGTGKTLLGLHFLLAGIDAGESVLYVHFEETTENVVADAESIGFDVSDVEFLDLSPDADLFTADRTYGLFDADEVESGDVAEAVVDAVDRVEPDRVFVDPLTQLRHLTPDDYQFKRTVASFMRYLTERGATVLFSTQPTSDRSDEDLEFLSAGTLELGRASKGRTVAVGKLRGSDFQRGTHTMTISTGGVRVYPELVPGEYERSFTAEALSTGVDEFDDLLGGGLERGTVTVVSGPTGVGKTTFATQFAQATASRGERSVLFLFEEAAETLRHRSQSISIGVSEMEAEGTLAIDELEPLSISPDEFAARVRDEVESRDARTVVIDSIASYRLTIRGDDDDLVRELHALCRYLRNMGVTVLLTDDVGSVTGEFEATSAPISYLADNIVFFRYVELNGELRRVAGVLKKRTSDFERTIRRFQITEDGFSLDAPLSGLRGILDGVPEERQGG
jgi:circadian clock protein KaiC